VDRSVRGCGCRCDRAVCAQVGRSLWGGWAAVARPIVGAQASRQPYAPTPKRTYCRLGLRTTARASRHTSPNSSAATKRVA